MGFRAEPRCAAQQLAMQLCGIVHSGSKFGVEVCEEAALIYARVSAHCRKRPRKASHQIVPQDWFRALRLPVGERIVS